MTARAYLQQLRKIETDMEILAEEIERRRAALTSITAPITGDRVQTSPGGDRFADQIALLADKEITFEERWERYERERKERVDRILGLQNPLYSRILYGHYVQNRQLQTIAAMEFYSVQYTYVLHLRALKAFEAAYPEILQR